MRRESLEQLFCAEAEYTLLLFLHVNITTLLFPKMPLFTTETRRESFVLFFSRMLVIFNHVSTYELLAGTLELVTPKLVSKLLMKKLGFLSKAEGKLSFCKS